jgi:hypothetical protein
MCQSLVRKYLEGSVRDYSSTCLEVLSINTKILSQGNRSPLRTCNSMRMKCKQVCGSGLYGEIRSFKVLREHRNSLNESEFAIYLKAHI